MLPSDFFRRNVGLSFQEDAIGIRLPRTRMSRPPWCALDPKIAAFS